MAQLRFYTGGQMISLQARPLADLAAVAAAGTTAKARGARSAHGGRPEPASAPGPRAMQAMRAQPERMAPLFNDFAGERTMALVMPNPEQGTVLVTETLVLGQASVALIRHLRSLHGLELVREGSHGKVLMKAPESGPAGIARVVAAARDAHERNQGRGAAHPNFVRVLARPRAGSAAMARGWHLLNDGTPGRRGADVAANAAWTITRGDPAVRVAVLDEGVDTLHPALKAAVVAERDFVDGRAHARPDGDDAHGTACAGIVLGRNKATPGLAPGCSLVAARIAKGDGQDGWVFDDFDTADAIDWCWDTAGAAVLSNSWGGGPPVDAITNAFERARRKGRGGKGAVIACATGNENSAIGYPATLPEVLSVGASTPWDERKSPTTADGEDWWGSNFGNAIDLVAPGVWIATTDIRGTKGYAGGATTDTFNGTSAATPHVAAAAALVLSVAPALTEARVRAILTASCDRINASGAWDRFVGNGRLNLHAALRLALR